MYRNDIDDNFFNIIPGKEHELFKSDAKGQLILKMSFWCLQISQITDKILLSISEQASKKRSNKESSVRVILELVACQLVL